MSRTLWLVVAFALGLTLGCGVHPPPTACDPLCPGCCDGNGKCLSGLEDAACGHAGAACAACSSGVACTAGYCGGPLDAGAGGAGDGGSKAAACASVFGSALTAAFGRVDGTITAVVTPSDTQCPLVNNDHVVVQVSMNGAIYRMVVNVLSTIGPPEVSYRTLDAPLQGGVWAEGWHTGLNLDYPTSLGVHSDAGFAAVPMASLIPQVVSELDIGAHVSVFASSSGGVNSSSTHLIHRNGANNDGAMVVNPDGPAPRWLLFHFPQQSF